MRNTQRVPLWPLFLILFNSCSQAYDVSKNTQQTLTEGPGPGGGDGPSLVSDSFSVEPEDRPVDILFVVDNSGSMKDEQENLALSFDLFINDMQRNDLDFQIGVISVDPTRPSDASIPLGTTAWTSDAYEDFSNRGTGSLLAYNGNEKVLTRDSPNLVSQFKRNVNLGTSGSSYEMAVQSLIYALSPDLSGVGKWNAGLFRPDALLSIIIVSDEDETRSVGDSNKYLFEYPNEKALRLAAFDNTALALKNNRRGLIRVDSIVSDPANPCGTSHKTGTTYPDLAKSYGGEVFSICNEFSDILETLGASITTQVLSSFALRKQAQSIQSVKLNGDLLVNNVSYIFNAQTNTLTLIGAALAILQTTNSTVEVNYLSQH